MDKAARAALELLRDGMQLGLGTGRAAEAFVRRLAERVGRGLRVRGVTTSTRTEKLASGLGIELVTLAEVVRLDLAVDGADEVTAELQLTKGLGGALLRERVVAHLADRFVIVVTPDKRVERLGEKAPIPIEVVPFAEAVVLREIEALGGRPTVRQGADGSPFGTDNGNRIVDAQFDPIDEPTRLDAALRAIPGVVDTGLFLDMADLVLVGASDRLERIER